MNSNQFQISEEMYATHAQRIANFFIDYFCQLLLLFSAVFVYIFITALFGSKEIPNFEGMGTLAEYAIGLVLLLVYYNVLEILFARTIAKFITKTIVVDEFGEKPSVNAILTRSICRAIPLEFLTFLGTPCRGWHDSFSDTYLVQKDLLDNAKAVFHSVAELGKSEE